MGFSLKKIVKAVAAPVTQSVKAVASVAQGDISGAVKNVTGAVAAANPLQMADAASDGAVAKAANYVPIVGTPINKSLTAGEKISSGQFSLRDVKNYATENVKLGALAYGGYLALPTLGVGGTLATGAAISSGDVSGAVSSIGGGYGFDQNLTDLVGGVSQNFNRKPDGYAPSNFTPTQSKPMPSVSKPSSLSKTEKTILGAAVAVAGFFLIRRLR